MVNIFGTSEGHGVAGPTGTIEKPNPPPSTRQCYTFSEHPCEMQNDESSIE